MKTKTHYLYSFIIILLTFALILTNVSKPKVEATTSPVETIPPIETTPPDEPTTDTQDIPSELYHDTYYTIATYSFCFGIFGLFTYSASNPQYRKHGYLILLILLEIILLYVIPIISLVKDKLHVNQYIMLILYMLFIPWVSFVKLVSTRTHER